MLAPESLLLAAVVVRAVPPLLEGLDARLESGLLSAAGVLAWLAIALFAWGLWSAARRSAPVGEAGPP